jgi:hypothetical protein
MDTVAPVDTASDPWCVPVGRHRPFVSVVLSPSSCRYVSAGDDTSLDER